MWFVIANPRSAGGKTEALLPALLAILRRHCPPFEVCQTKAPGDGIALARDAALQGASLVIALGGDGTTHEVVQGLMQAQALASLPKPPSLGLLPQGTGGDLRRSFFTEHRLDLYLQALLSPHTQAIDLAEVSFLDHKGLPAKAYMINVLSAGLGGLVDQLVSQHAQQKGAVAYFLASARALLRSDLLRLHLSLETPQGPLSLDVSSRNLAVCNGRFFGGGMKIAPHADPSDGWFEIVNFSPADRLGLLPIAASLYQGDLSGLSDVQRWQARQIDIALAPSSLGVAPAATSLSSAPDALLDIDGECLGRLPLRLRLLPRALSLKVLSPGKTSLF